MNVPVYSTFMGKGACPRGTRSTSASPAAGASTRRTEAARNADVILAIGCRFSDIHCSSWVPGYTYNIPPTKLIHVDIDPTEIGRNYPTELGIVGDAREVLEHSWSWPARAETRAVAVARRRRGLEVEWQNYIEPEWLGTRRRSTRGA